jgi:4'-phosphopantetheinyl transferase
MITVLAKSCREHELPSSDSWLSAPERATLDGMRIDKRRRDFRIGRHAVRRAIQAAAPGRDVVVRAAADGAPELFDANGEPLGWVVSISHSAGLGVAAVAQRAPGSGLELGCDVELVAPRSDELVHQFFTDAEQRAVFAAEPTHRAFVANLIWSAKESALKAQRTGLRVDTRSVEVTFEHGRDERGFGRLAATVGPKRLVGHYAALGTSPVWVFTLLADRASAPPIGLI